ncbi:uncharacterized protein LAJ45_09630 [Morchella importuna]|uniref:uncharacterized protein n=1 Tax=Morchella importuna TaxID=1174673 RepID=UPI001E8DC851|nr:uncharacterized protein LAJ45_09630 [Morchella importuna]KAH8146437.1 hypothetical protein LAJ45_09630 [Morchella importuna]
MSTSQPSPAPITPTTDTTLLSELCPFCNAAPPKYRCPACDARTCSLTCSKRHKTYKQCSGTRDPTAYLKRSALTTPSALNRDFNFLTGVEKAVLRADGGAEEEEQEKVNKQKLQNRQAFIEKSGVVFKSAPRGLKRARENKTDVVKTKKQRVLGWTVEWIMCDEGNRRILDDRITETSILFHAFFHPNNGESRKKAKAEMAKTRFYLRKVGTPANKPTLIQLNPLAALKDCLRGRIVEEYPTLYVTSQEGHPQGWEIDASIAADTGGKLEVLEETGEVNLDALEKIVAGNMGDSLVEESGAKEEVPKELVEEELVVDMEDPSGEVKEGGTKDSEMEGQTGAPKSAISPEGDEVTGTK